MLDDFENIDSFRRSVGTVRVVETVAVVVFDIVAALRIVSKVGPDHLSNERRQVNQSEARGTGRESRGLHHHS